MAAELGIPLAEDKTEGAVTPLVYLGIQLDMEAGTSHLLECRLSALREIITALLPWKKCTLKELQEELGHLHFACRVVSQGSTFCTNLASATSIFFVLYIFQGI